MSIIGYAYNSEIHCMDCTLDAISNGVLKLQTKTRQVQGIDGIEILENITDMDGNPIHPIYDTDDNSESEVCADCKTRLIDLQTVEHST